MHLLNTVTFATLASAGIISLPFKKGQSHHEKRSLRHLGIRDNKNQPVTLPALNKVAEKAYYTELEIGTPPQKLTFLLDTGSSDTWVNSVSSDACDEPSTALEQVCKTPFNPRGSSTYKSVEKGGFQISYLDGRGVRGDYFNDTVTFEGAVVKDQQLGLGLRSKDPDMKITTGLIGLGLSNNVASSDKYNTLVDNLFLQGHINARAFSLYLNDLEAESGTILFGAVDRKKFVGNLAKLPIQLDSNSESSDITSYTVNLDRFEVEGIDNVAPVKVPVVLDSGSTVSILPSAQVKPLWDFFGVQDLQGTGTPLVDCDMKNSAKKTKYHFTFGGTTVTVPGSELVIDYLPQNLQDQVASFLGVKWKHVCLFGISTLDKYLTDPTTTLAILGDTFLRSAYVVYDIDHKTIGIAQANVETKDSDIVMFQRNGSIPNVKGVDRLEKEPDSAAGTLGAPSAIYVGAVTLFVSVVAMMSVL